MRKIKEKTIFITGGAGFISSHLIKKLIEDNTIIVYDIFSRNAMKDLGIDTHPNLTVIKGDVLDLGRLKKSIPANVEMVLHFAAIAGINSVTRNPTQTLKVNFIGTLNILEALRELKLSKKIERFIDFSTSEVFGIRALNVDEKMPLNVPPVGEARWTYAASKLAAEHLTSSYRKEFDLPAVILRPFNIYGPGQVGEGAIHNFVTEAIKGKPLTIYGDGSQIRAWCYVDDMVEGITLALTNEKAVGEVFNIGNPKGVITISNLAKKIVLLARSPSKIVHKPKSKADVEIRIPSIEKAKKLLKFRPKVGLDEGLKKTIEWYRQKML